MSETQFQRLKDVVMEKIPFLPGVARVECHKPSPTGLSPGNGVLYGSTVKVEFYQYQDPDDPEAPLHHVKRSLEKLVQDLQVSGMVHLEPVMPEKRAPFMSQDP